MAKKTIGEAVKEVNSSDLAVYILLDRSGSMGGIWGKTLEGLNSYIRGLPEGTHITLAAFDAPGSFIGMNPTSMDFTVLREGRYADNWRDVGILEASPRGGTPLFDAAVKLYDKAINHGKHEKTVFVIVTDGGENASKMHNGDHVKERMAQAGKRGWETVFLGANFDQVEREAYGLGIAASNAATYSVHNTAEVYGDLGHRTRSYARGIPCSFNYSDSEKAKMVAPETKASDKT